MAAPSTAVNLVTCELDSRPHDELSLCLNPQPVKPLQPLQPLAPTLTAAQQRKQRPIYSGVLAYFPDAIEEVSHVSFVGNQQHNPGEPLHWAKDKSTDELDALMRHLKDHAAGEVFDTDGVRHLAKVGWRAFAMLQREIDKEKSNGASRS